MENGENVNERTKKLVICALLVAIGTILGGLGSVPLFSFGVYSVKIGFGVLSVILAGVLYGPVYGGMVGGLADLLQALLFPKGPFMPWFTLVGVLFGLIPGLFFMKKQPVTFKRLFLAVTAGQLIGSVLLNTALLVWLYGVPWVVIWERLLKQVVMIPVYTVMVYSIVKLLQRSAVIK